MMQVINNACKSSEPLSRRPGVGTLFSVLGEMRSECRAKSQYENW